MLTSVHGNAAKLMQHDMRIWQGQNNAQEDESLAYAKCDLVG